MTAKKKGCLLCGFLPKVAAPLATQADEQGNLEQGSAPTLLTGESTFFATQRGRYPYSASRLGKME